MINSTSKYTEAELVTLLKQRDRSAFDHLYENYSGALYTIVCNIVSDKETGNDVLQEVFIKIWRQIEQYNETKGRLFTWMLNIARNASIDYVRSRQFKNSRQNLELTDTVYDGGEGVQLNTDKIGLKRIVEKLPEDYRRLVELAYFKGYTQEEISDLLKVPLGTVKTRLRKALTDLRKMM
ncbi:MAG: sigma-70 family polymerase sigma factor [Chitinophagaceae bacterium]|nr:sigma-70 family polymerase sigma factor [Chitinophagaceae bacterium]